MTKYELKLKPVENPRNIELRLGKTCKVSTVPNML